MKKSLFTFGLLASSLVLLAVMPFLNNNNSFSNTAFAQEYGMDSYKKYNDNYNAENIECSNINININTEDNDRFSRTPNVNNGKQLSANAFGNYEGNNGFKQNDEDVVLKCIQNNNNGNDTNGEVDTCLECFALNATLSAAIEANLGEIIVVPFGPFTFEIPADVKTVGDLCEFIDTHLDTVVGISLTTIVTAIIESILEGEDDISETSIVELVECVLKVPV